jgi:HSP20 family protein
MATYLWDPFATFSRFDREFDEIVRRGFGARERSARAGRIGFVPATDVVTDGDDVLIHVELPGLDVEKDVQVELERGRLVIRGQRQTETRRDSRGVVLRERRHGSFQRAFTLPEGVGADAISATYDQGVLTVRLADAHQERSNTRIPVTAAAPKAVEIAAEGSDSAGHDSAGHDSAGHDSAAEQPAA